MLMRLRLRLRLNGNQTFCYLRGAQHVARPIKVKLLKSPTDAQSNYSIPLVNCASRSDAREN